MGRSNKQKIQNPRTQKIGGKKHTKEKNIKRIN